VVGALFILASSQPFHTRVTNARWENDLSKILNADKGRVFASIVFLAGYCLDAVTQLLETRKHRPSRRPSLAHPDATVQIWVRDLANHALLRLHILHGKINRVRLGHDQSCICSFQRHTHFQRPPFADNGPGSRALQEGQLKGLAASLTGCDATRTVKRTRRALGQALPDRSALGQVSVREGEASPRSIQLLLVFVSTVDPNHDPTQSAHCAPHRHARY
jgi:hypothetical protein